MLKKKTKKITTVFIQCIAQTDGMEIILVHDILARHPCLIGLPDLLSACISRLSLTGHLWSIWGLQLGQNSCSCGVFGRCAMKEVWRCSGAWFVSSSIDLDRAKSLTKPGWMSDYSVSHVMLLHPISALHSIVSLSCWARFQPSLA